MLSSYNSIIIICYKAGILVLKRHINSLVGITSSKVCKRMFKTMYLAIIYTNR